MIVRANIIMDAEPTPKGELNTMLFKVVSKNSETVQITHFNVSNSPEDQDPDAVVLQTVDLLIPADAGPYAAAAMVLGFRDNFLNKVKDPKDYTKDEIELFAHSQAVLETLSDAVVPQESALLKK